MTCPQCTTQVWATFVCDDGRHRCWQCKAIGKGRIIGVHGKPRPAPKFIIAPVPPEERIERPYVTRRKK